MGTVGGFRDDDAFCCIKPDHDFCRIVDTIFETETTSASPLINPTAFLPLVEEI